MKIDALDKKIEVLKEDIKFYRTLLFALLSGIVWYIYVIMEHKSNSNSLMLVVTANIVLVYLNVKLKFLKKDQDNLIDELERIE